MKGRPRKLTDDKLKVLLAWKGFGVLCRELGVSRAQGNAVRQRFKMYGYCYKKDQGAT